MSPRINSKLRTDKHTKRHRNGNRQKIKGFDPLISGLDDEKKRSVRTKRLRALLRELKHLYPEEKNTILRYSTEWELMVAVQLSAQCTDERVNVVTASLFAKYRTLDDYADADWRALAQDIRSVTYFNNKARNIIGAARMVREQFGGTLPKTMDDMVRLPGVARKTANVVLGNHGVVEGIAVDTHVMRFMKRFSLSDATTPERVERDLMEMLPKRDWPLFTNLVIAYGRDVGRARGYDPAQDPLVKATETSGRIAS